MNLAIEVSMAAISPTMPMRTTTGRLSNTPIITGTGATNMIKTHLKKLIAKG
ncbi:MAG: hypothetical protein ACK4Z9_06870 [Thermodesulfovibrionales bacterium]